MALSWESGRMAKIKDQPVNTHEKIKFRDFLWIKDELAWMRLIEKAKNYLCHFYEQSFTNSYIELKNDLERTSTMSSFKDLGNCFQTCKRLLVARLGDFGKFCYKRSQTFCYFWGNFWKVSPIKWKMLWLLFGTFGPLLFLHPFHWETKSQKATLN